MSIQDSLFFPSVGTIAMVYSTIQQIFILNKARYAVKNFKHPYAPWKKDHDDEKVYRGWKAGENSREWLLYILPFYWIANLYASSLPTLILGDNTIELATHAPLFLMLVALVYSYSNVSYCKGYMESTEGRMPPFKTRTRCAKVFLYGAIIVLGCYALRRFIFDGRSYPFGYGPFRF